MGRFLLYEAATGFLFIALARLCLHGLPPVLGRIPFALCNLAFVGFFWLWSPGVAPGLAVARLGVYVLLVVIHYLLMLRMSEQSDRAVWPAAVYPIVLLILLKYVRFLWVPLAALHGLNATNTQTAFGATFVGLSYMAFRLSHFAVEVRNGTARMPTLSEHIAYAFFAPTLPVGPISPGSVFLSSLDSPDRQNTPIIRSLLRIVVGATKYLFLAGMLGHLTYADLLDDGHPHSGATDYLVSAIAYYGYLYCNFSGFCDIAIGGAGLIGVSIVENFNKPLMARNIRDFWSRWHISLSNYVREMLFSPMSKGFARKMAVNEAIAAALLITFVATGVWHGVGLNFLLFGLAHALGMIIHHYYTIFLRNRFSRDQLRRYHENKVVRAAATSLTFAFVTMTFFFFANDVTSMKRILRLGPNLPERAAIGL